MREYKVRDRKAFLNDFFKAMQMEDISRNEIELDILTLMKPAFVLKRLNVLKTQNTIPKLYFFLK